MICGILNNEMNSSYLRTSNEARILMLEENMEESLNIKENIVETIYIKQEKIEDTLDGEQEHVVDTLQIKEEILDDTLDIKEENIEDILDVQQQNVIETFHIKEENITLDEDFTAKNALKDPLHIEKNNKTEEGSKSNAVNHNAEESLHSKQENDEDIKLISLLEKSPILFDKNREDFHQNDEKLNVWKSIANEFGKNVEFCRRRWTYLRQKFIRIKSTLPSGATPEQSTWELYPYMLFMLPHVKIGRKTRTNIKAQCQPPLEQPEASSSQMNEVEILEGTYNDDTSNINNSEPEVYSEFLDVNQATTSTTSTNQLYAATVTQNPSFVDQQTSTTEKKTKV